MQRSFNISLRHLQKLALEKQKKSKTYIKFGNNESQAEKSLFPTQKLNRFDHKR